ncbi:MAG: S8 family serine peptidase [Leptospirales bacterium]|nr:S8 family serine peptidase [Leptospirales bacterium]
MKFKYMILFCSVFLITASMLGCGDGEDSLAKNPGAVIPPDTHIGNNCGPGGKTSDGSGMTLSCSKNGFAKTNKNEYVPGEVLVKFKDDTSDIKSSQIMNKFGLGETKDVPFVHNGRLKKIRLNDGINIKDAIAQYKSQTDVEYAEPNYIYRITATEPNDPDFNMQWGLNNTGQTVNGDSSTNGKDIKAVEAWGKFSNDVNCNNVIVAVIDTGVNYNHRDIKDNMWNGGKTYPNHGYNFVDKNKNPMDLNGHGTHCAGIIGAKGNDGIGIAGVCWKVKIMAVRVLNHEGEGETSDIAAGIKFAVDNGAHIINASFGGEDSITIRNAIEYANSKGVIIVAAAGNEKTNAKTYPAAYSSSSYPKINNIISVGAIDQDGDLAYFSNYGDWVDIASPGVNILSTWPGQHVATTEDFTDWIYDEDETWGRETSAGNIDMLTNPSPFTGTYERNLNSMTFQVFDLKSYKPVSAFVSYYVDIDIYNGDDLYFMINTFGGRPTSTLDSFPGYYKNWEEYDLTSYIDRNISLGFNFVTDNTSKYLYKGVRIAQFDVTRLHLNDNACLYLDGTSMATPYVSGVAALSVQRYMNNKRSYKKTTDYTKIISAIYDGASTYSGGKSIAGNKMLNASGAIDEIDSL